MSVDKERRAQIDEEARPGYHCCGLLPLDQQCGDLFRCAVCLLHCQFGAVTYAVRCCVVPRVTEPYTDCHVIYTVLISQDCLLHQGSDIMGAWTVCCINDTAHVLTTCIFRILMVGDCVDHPQYSADCVYCSVRVWHYAYYTVAASYCTVYIRYPTDAAGPSFALCCCFC